MIQRVWACIPSFAFHLAWVQCNAYWQLYATYAASIVCVEGYVQYCVSIKAWSNFLYEIRSDSKSKVPSNNAFLLTFLVSNLVKHQQCGIPMYTIGISRIFNLLWHLPVVLSLSNYLRNELNLAQLVKGVGIHPDHPGSSPLWLGFGCLFLLN
jgi:hypothetical protein